MESTSILTIFFTVSDNNKHASKKYFSNEHNYTMKLISRLNTELEPGMKTVKTGITNILKQFPKTKPKLLTNKNTREGNLA